MNKKDSIILNIIISALFALGVTYAFHKAMNNIPHLYESAMEEIGYEGMQK